MSIFSKKVLDGRQTTDEEWKAHLKKAHDSDPGRTPRVLSGLKNQAGNNSYAHLAESLDGAHSPFTLLDLACGNGFLAKYCLERFSRDDRYIGVDLSEGELTEARRLNTDPRLEFKQGEAQKLPLKNSSVDTALCHMGLMLMLPVEPVVSELSRVLKPGGRFAAVIGSRDTTTRGLFPILQKHIAEEVHRHFPEMTDLRMGDPRVLTREGLGTLFTPQLGFGPVSAVEDWPFALHTTPDGVWDFLRGLYAIALLPPDFKKGLRAQVTDLAAQYGDGQRLKMEFQLRSFSVRKNP